MSIFSLMTIATDSSSSRCRRALAAWAAALVVAVGFLAAPSRAADEAARKSVITKNSSAASDAPAPEKHASNSSVMCNGIRLEDEIDVVNTRSICGGGNSDLMRNGLKFETYAVCDDAGARRWQQSDLDSFLSFDP